MDRAPRAPAVGRSKESSSAPIDEAALADRLIHGLKRAGLTDPNVTVVDEDLQRHPQSGKLRRFVPLGANV